jgi:hypothetical protein
MKPECNLTALNNQGHKTTHTHTHTHTNNLLANEKRKGTKNERCQVTHLGFSFYTNPETFTNTVAPVIRIPG